MLPWHVLTLFVCLYGVVKEFRPATPFLTPFLVSSEKNFTIDVVYKDIYPYSTYSYLIFLVPILALTDVLRYKPLIVAEAVGLCATWAFLVWAKTVWLMQIMQVCFGLASAAEIAFFSYLYAVVDARHYRRVASWTKTSALIGKLFAFGLAQVIVSYSLGSYLLLNQITFGACAIAVVVALALPTVPANRNDTVRSTDLELTEELSSPTEEAKPLPFWSRLAVYRDDTVVLKWSVWWALLSCSMYQVYNYVQTLWIEIDSISNTGKVENGLVEFVNTLLGAFISFGVQFINFDATSAWADTFLILSAVALGASTLVMSCTSSLYMAYLMYIIAVFVYHAICPVTHALIAKQLEQNLYGFIFGANALTALLLQSAITFCIVNSSFTSLTIQQQFMFYAAIFLGTGVIFTIVAVASALRRRSNSSSSS